MDFLDSLKSAFTGESSEEEELYPDESPSPKLNLLIRAARKVADGRAGPGDLRAELDAAYARLEIALAQHDELARQEISGEVREIAARMRSSYEAFGHGLRCLEAYLEGLDPSLLEQGLELCKAATGAIIDGNSRFEEMARREQMVACVMCGHRNEPRARHCARCEAVLPAEMERSAATAEASSGDMVAVPPEYMVLYRACDDVAYGKIPVHEWRTTVDGLQATLAATEGQVRQHLGLHAEVLRDSVELQPVAEALVEGLRQGQEALRRMAAYQEDRDPDHLNQGWMDLLKATRSVQRSTWIFHQAMQALQRQAGG